ncbi:MAG: hypothetical protein ACLUFU_02325 [Bacilli bacterium]
MKKKLFLIMLVISIFILILFIVFKMLLFLGKIQDYKCLLINNDNKENIINLLQEQEENMFNLKTNINLSDCYKKIERIEAVYFFPDGENYVIYCKENKVSFSLDNSNYNLPKYISENGNTGFRFN